MSDIGRMTHGILDNVADLHDIWRQPSRRNEFGPREMEDIELAKDKLAELEQFALIHQSRKMRGIA